MALKSTLLLLSLFSAVLGYPLHPHVRQSDGSSLGTVGNNTRIFNVKRTADQSIHENPEDYQAKVTEAILFLEDERNRIREERCRRKGVSLCSELPEEERAVSTAEIFKSLSKNRNNNAADAIERKVLASQLLPDIELNCIRLDYTETFSITLLEVCTDNDSEDGFCICPELNGVANPPKATSKEELWATPHILGEHEKASIPEPIYSSHSALRAVDENHDKDHDNKSEVKSNAKGEANSSTKDYIETNIERYDKNNGSKNDKKGASKDTMRDAKNSGKYESDKSSATASASTKSDSGASQGGISRYKKIITDDGTVILQFYEDMPRELIGAICQAEFAESAERAKACVQNAV